MYRLTGQVGGALLKIVARRKQNITDPIAAQQEQLLQLVDQAKDTVFGRDHDFGAVRSVFDYQQRVPIRSFDEFWLDYWSSPFPLLTDVTWPGKIRYFAKSSGTTSGESKHIPCSDEMIKSNNTGGLQVLLHHLRNNPRSKISGGRTFLFGGSPNLDELAPGVLAGELSGIAARETPAWAGRGRYYPPPHLAGLTDWNDKLNRLANDCVGKNIRSISGVPTWLQILFERTLDANPSGDRRLASIFPDLELITHGGISFEPYETTFARFLAGSGAELREVYAASEGFIAIADRGYRQGLQMLIDNGLFFEFVEIDQLDTPHPKRRWIGDAELDTEYALIVTTNAGLWSYTLGDIVRLVDLDPPRLVVVGRVSQTLSSFGEHISGEQLEIAVATAAAKLGLTVRDFAVAPIVGSAGAAVGYHRYLIETTSNDAAGIAAEIDASLSGQNADYRTKRVGDVAIAPPHVEIIPAGTFAAWMITNGKAGGQHKVRRVTTADQLGAITKSRQ